MSVFQVVHIVAAEVLGGSPWIATEDDSRIEADSYYVDADGYLHLVKDGRQAATFPPNIWVSVKRIEVSA